MTILDDALATQGERFVKLYACTSCGAVFVVRFGKCKVCGAEMQIEELEQGMLGLIAKPIAKKVSHES